MSSTRSAWTFTTPLTTRGRTNQENQTTNRTEQPNESEQPTGTRGTERVRGTLRRRGGQAPPRPRAHKLRRGYQTTREPNRLNEEVKLKVYSLAYVETVIDLTTIVEPVSSTLLTYKKGENIGTI